MVIFCSYSHFTNDNVHDPKGITRVAWMFKVRFHSKSFLLCWSSFTSKITFTSKVLLVKLKSEIKQPTKAVYGVETQLITMRSWSWITIARPSFANWGSQPERVAHVSERACMMTYLFAASSFLSAVRVCPHRPLMRVTPDNAPIPLSPLHS